MTRAWMPVLAILLSAARANADDLTKFVSDLEHRTDSGAYLKSCDLLVTPAGEVRRPCALSAADLGASRVASFAVTGVKEHAFPKSQRSWREATVNISAEGKPLGSYRVVEIGTSTPAGFKVLAAHWYRLVPDADAVAAARGGKLATLKPIKDSTSPDPVKGNPRADDRNAAISDVKAATLDGDLPALFGPALDDGGVLVGSAANQTIMGKAGAKEVRGWKMTLKRTGGMAVGGNEDMAWGAVQVTGTMADPADKKAKPLVVPYTSLYVITRHMTGGGGLAPQHALTTFAITP